MTRVLMTADAVGGVWTYALELCHALASHGVEVALATMGDAPTADQLAQAAAIPNLAMHVSRYKLEWMSDPWSDVDRAGQWLLDLERRLRPDVIHLNGYVHAAADWRAPVLVVGHSCVLSWWEAVKNESLPDSWLDYAARVSHGLQAAAHVVAPSQAMLNCLRRHYRQLPPATVIHNGRRRDLFHTEAKKELILSAGRLWDEAKNLQALDAVADRLPWPIVVAGDTEPHAKPANVRCIGRLNEQALAQCMSEAAIYALPAKYEPFGLSALEAALSGCALVLGDIPSQRELWEDAALFADPNDHEQLAATLRRCIEQPALRRQMAHRAGVRASLYTTRAMAEKYLKVYGQLLSEPAGVSEQSLQTLKG